MSLRDRAEAVILPTYPERPLALVRGVGCTVWDEDGNAYLDLVGGLAVNSLGYGHPAAVQALAEQAAVLGHVSNLFYSEPMVALAERLCALSGQDRAFFCNSGAEAGRGRRSSSRAGSGAPAAGPQKHHIVCVEGAFHGRTLATLAAGWSAAKREPFEPVPAGFEHVPRNDLEALAAAVGPETCAVLVEPIQGEGGVWPIDSAPGSSSRASSATATGRCSCTTRCRPASAAAARGSAASSRASGPMRSPSPRASPAGSRSARCSRPISPTRASSAATTRRPSAARRRSPPPRSRCSPRSSARAWSRTRARSASTSAARAGALPGVDHVRGAGLLLGIELADAPAAEVSDALRARGILVNAITPTALRLVPPLCLSQGEADRFCATFEAVLAARRGQHATTVA